MIRNIFLAVITLVLGLVVAMPTYADGSKKKDGKAKDGVVKSVDASASTVTLEDGTTLKVDDKTKITRDGKPAKVGDLQAGDTVKYNVANDKTTFIHAEHKK